jgi:hypothetical protein
MISNAISSPFQLVEDMPSDGPFGAAPDIGVGFSDAALLLVSVAGFCFLSVSTFRFGRVVFGVET